jgi:D-amino-acid oxidase
LLSNPQTKMHSRDTKQVFNPSITKCVMAVDANSVHTYIIPRPNGDVVLGGTVQAHNWNEASDVSDAQGVWERCCTLYPEVKSSRVIARVAGLRPGRTDGVRLEADARRTARGAFVIHNYGHSGSGHTLQWGCALDVVRLATDKFPLAHGSKL